ncbi:hypothetical protein [Chryseobacterium carnipullorum]|uniref:hypothetical protein n=1 Tax=Chryseobacterium carnipullorum TaxID=1124835 RepID=UPI0023F3000C|nr:hypothetical protein [Chryseobacterium carnipullorum]
MKNAEPQNENYLLLNHDVLIYPPILSLITILLEENQKVTLLGYCSDLEKFQSYIDKGLIFYNLLDNDTESSKFNKTLNYMNYRRNVKKTLSNEKKNVKLWFLGNEVIYLFNDLLEKYHSIIYFFEVPELKVPNRYRLLSPFFNYKNCVRKAKQVICCEYNRGLITRAYFGLSQEPIIIPNKPSYFINESDIHKLDDYIEQKIENKKIILYQGGFNFPERRLDELCDSINFLPSEFIILIMGPDTDYKRVLISKYKENERIVFLPFIGAPNHLHITKRARIGFLSYFSNEGNIQQILNILYCAPNKVFEYAKYGIPMVSNNLPSMEYFIGKFKSGKTIKHFTPENIANAVLQIDSQYEIHSNGSCAVFDSVNIQEIIRENFI